MTVSRFLFGLGALFAVIAGLIAAGTIAAGNPALWFDLAVGAGLLGLAFWDYRRPAA